MSDAAQEPVDRGRGQTDRQPHEGRHAPPPSRGRRLRNVLATVPIVMVSSVAMSLNMLSPANATAPAKKAERGRTDSTPRLKAVAREAAAPTRYTVVEGDTVSGIAARYGLSTAGVLAMNGLSWRSLIFPGQVLVLAETATAPAPPVTVQPAIVHYTIRSGDTISGIASAHGLSTDAVLSANGLSRSSIIYPGQTIALPDPVEAGQAGAAPAAVAQAAASEPTPAPAPAPVASAALTELTDEMRANARVIVQVGREQGVSDFGLVVALAAAMQESGLRNVDFGDRDSLGLFQQRPSMGWGTASEVMDPVFASRSFFGGAGNPHPGLTRGLLDIPGWQHMTVAQAAQAVQLSAYPDSYGRWAESASAWLAELG
jgi:LysM repeat protein